MAISSNFSSLQFSVNSRNRISEVQQKLTQAANELATGVRTDVYANFGMRSAQTLDLRNQKVRVEAFVVNNQVLSGKLEVADTALAHVRETVQEFLALSIRSNVQADDLAGELQTQARAALDQIQGALNASYVGEYLFSGIDTDKQPLQHYSDKNAATGFSPEDVLTGIVGGALSDATDAGLKIAEMDAVFTNSSATPGHDFEATFYNGTPQLDGLGAPSERVTSTISDGETINSGLQANDKAIRDMLQGLMMFASIDVSKIGDADAFSAWVGRANEALASGLSGVDKMRVELGNNQALVETRISSLQAKSVIYNNQVADFEGVDPYDAATRVESLRATLEATYAVTGRINGLSFLNYMR